jgi:hypothetical protein
MARTSDTAVLWRESVLVTAGGVRGSFTPGRKARGATDERSKQERQKGCCETEPTFTKRRVDRGGEMIAVECRQHSPQGRGNARRMEKRGNSSPVLARSWI